MSVGGIEPTGFTPYLPPTVTPTQAADVGSSGFADLVVDGLDRLQAVQAKADGLAVQAATGDLGAIHDYTIAASEAAVTTQLTVAVRNKALESFTEIMRMPI